MTTLLCYQCLANHEATEALSVLDGWALCTLHLSEHSKELKREHDALAESLGRDSRDRSEHPGH